MTSRTDILNSWQELTNSALLGTARSRSGSVATSGLNVAFNPPAESQESLMLREAALLAPLARAGRLVVGKADGTLTDIEPAPQERRVVVNERASSNLATILGSPNQHGILIEWLSECAKAGKRVPHFLLPDLLEWAKRAGTSQLVCSVIGTRGFWLASQNSNWSYIEKETLRTQFDDAPLQNHISAKSEHEINETWRVGEKEQRISLLKALREQNPLAALELVADKWLQENASTRALILSAFRIGISPADELFFEAALDDKSRDVRAVAADVLMSMSGSALSMRYRERAKALVRAVKPLLDKVRLELNATDDADATLLRDGYDLQKTDSVTAGAKAYMVQVVVGAVPPSLWLTELSVKMSPAQFVEAVKACDWAVSFFQGLLKSTVRFHDVALLEPLLEGFVKGNFRMELGRSDVTALIRSLPEDRYRLIEQKIATEPSPTFPALIDKLSLLASFSGEVEVCSIAVGRTWLAQFKVMASSANDAARFQATERNIWLVGSKLPIELVDAVATGWPAQVDPGEQWAGFAAEVQAVMLFRNEMIREINAP